MINFQTGTKLILFNLVYYLCINIKQQSIWIFPKGPKYFILLDVQNSEECKNSMRFMKLQDQIWQNSCFVLFCLKRFRVAHILITSFYEKAFVYDFIIIECYSHSTKGIWSTTPPSASPNSFGGFFVTPWAFLNRITMRQQVSLLLREEATLNFCFSSEQESLIAPHFGKIFLLTLPENTISLA